MSELVERLKAYAKDQGGWHNIDDTCEEAAAEITRLTGELAVQSEQAETSYRQLMMALEKLSASQARVKALEEALSQSREWFGQYAASHTAKGDTDKAQRNQDRADFCARAMEGE